jgi:hypothetical protein
LQEGRQHETQSPLREQQMPPGSQLIEQGVFFLMGYKDPVTLWNAMGERVEVLDLLPTDEQEVLDLPVMLGT